MTIRHGGGRIIAAIVALGLVAVRPILGPSLPCSDDAAFHLLRLTQLDHLLRQGVLYSRWAPDMAQGYGYPFFNFYAPLSYYVAAAVSLVVANLHLGLRLTFALIIIASGLAAYRLARDHFGQPAALVAAVAYMYAPYLGYDIYFRGNLAEAAAWPLLPLSLWAMGRLARGGGRRWLAATAVSYAAVLLTHNVFALIFSPLLAAYGLIEAWRTKDQGPRTKVVHRSLFIGLWSLVLGLALSAFFWLPAVIERDLVHSDRLLVPPIFVYWNNFLPLAELLSPPQVIHPELINPSPPRTLGLVTVLLAAPSLVGLVRFKDGRRRQLAFFALVLLVYAFMMTAAARPVWDNLPLIEFVQFPWRLLGPAAVCLSMLVGAAVEVLGEGRKTKDQRPKVITDGRLAAVFIVALVLADLFWLDPRYCPGLERPTVADGQAFERATATIGTTAKGEYLPRAVRLFPPQPAQPLFASETLPDGVTLVEQRPRAVGGEAWLETAQPQTVTLDHFAYSGWRVAVDGEVASITPSVDYGLITFPLPAGRHYVSLRFSETRLRLAAGGVSGAALVALLALAIWVDGVKSQRGKNAANKPPHVSRFTFHALGLALFLLVVLIVPRVPNPLYRPGLRDGTLAGVAVLLGVDFGGGLRLLGYQQGAAEIEGEETVRLDLYWTLRHAPEVEHQSVVHLVGPDGQVWSPKDSVPPRDFRAPPPATTWQPGQYAQDSHLVTPLAGTPPGVYDLRLTLFDRQSLVPMPVLNGNGTAGSSTLVLGQVTVTRPAQPPDVMTLQPQYESATQWGPLQLVGYNLDRAEAAPGGPFLLTLFWQATAAPSEDWRARLTLVGPDGREGVNVLLPPVRADFPTTEWQAGDGWRGQHVLRLPAGLEDGRHEWQLHLCRSLETSCEPIGAATSLGALQIDAPERIYQSPPLDVMVNARLGEVATLMGMNLEPAEARPGETLTVTLVWRAEAETAVSYRVFLHLVAANGQIVTQADGEPAGWTRPTTGWLPGEIILDERLLVLPADLPPGSYSLNVGLYDLATGERLRLPDGTTAVQIPLIVR